MAKALSDSEIKDQIRQTENEIAAKSKEFEKQGKVFKPNPAGVIPQDVFEEKFKNTAGSEEVNPDV